MSKSAIVIFTKAPIPGLVKTRLAGPLTPEQCAELYKCFLVDLLATATQLSCSLFVAYAPLDSENLFRGLAAPNTKIFPQEGNDLGEIMLNAATYISGLGKNRIIFVGADIPALSKAHIVQALKSLDKFDVCIGPAYDGGYYLIGFREPEPRLFEGIAWSTSKVLEQTLHRVQSLGLTCFCLPMLRDVDTVEDLVYLYSQLQDSSLSTRAPHTKEYLGRLDLIKRIYPPKQWD